MKFFLSGVDKNECKDKDSNECHKYAVCINEDGGYKCRCRKGFEQHKEGRVCIRKSKMAFLCMDRIFLHC